MTSYVSPQKMLNCPANRLLMPGTRNQEERIEVLDRLFSHGRKWTSKELLCRMAGETGSVGIDKRTLYRYFNYLEEKGAPLHRPEKSDAYYYYKHKFSLREVILDADEVSALKRAIDILKEVDNFEILEEVDSIIKKLENRIHANVPESATIVQFEKHTIADGHEYFNELFDAIQTQSPIRLLYQKFDRNEPLEQVVHPYLLKEFRNRWFLIGRMGHNKTITTYGLERIKGIKTSDADFIPNDVFDPMLYYENVVGVTIYPGDEPKEIHIKAYPSCVPYVKTKPIHKHQEVIKEYKDGVTHR